MNARSQAARRERTKDTTRNLCAETETPGPYYRSTGSDCHSCRDSAEQLYQSRLPSRQVFHTQLAVREISVQRQRHQGPTIGVQVATVIVVVTVQNNCIKVGYPLGRCSTHSWQYEKSLCRDRHQGPTIGVQVATVIVVVTVQNNCIKVGYPLGRCSTHSWQYDKSLCRDRHQGPTIGVQVATVIVVVTVQNNCIKRQRHQGPTIGLQVATVIVVVTVQNNCIKVGYPLGRCSMIGDCEATKASMDR
ncbi:hypothetical protein J6590_067728 [Homalodisca vitripennis]|nr:hypothetical protein J6590_067728 [Homalodisca vitripennis]